MRFFSRLVDQSFVTSILLLCVACNIPHDPKDSWQEAQAEGLLVGVVNNPPFSSYEGDTFTGSEVDLMKGFARQHELQIEFLKGSESHLMKELEHFRLHYVIGGFEKNTQWKKKVGVSYAYREHQVVLAAPGENRTLFYLDGYLYNWQNKHP